MKMPSIHCATCNTLVEKIETWRDYMSNNTVIRVSCHGASEQMEVTLSMMIRDGIDMCNGVAFIPKLEGVK